MTATPADLGIDDILATSLYAFSGLGKVLKIKVEALDEVIYLVPGPAHIDALVKAGAKRGRIWCVCEVLDLLLTGVRPDDARKVIRAKLQFDGEVVHARKEGA